MNAVTIVFAGADLSIPSAAEMPLGRDGEASTDTETHFFNLLRDSNPDAVVLDLSSLPSLGVKTILKIRQQARVPILVVCDLCHPSAREFRIAGAAGCIPTPIDILVLNDRLQRIIRANRRVSGQRITPVEAFSFGEFVYYPHRDQLAVANGATTGLTTSESRLLLHFMSRPWRLCPREEIAEVLYGGDWPKGDRAIDIVVTRLRRKLVVLGGTAARALIKTEFRRGYLFVAGVSTTYERHTTDAVA
jgi:two-component system OmpR family response regulator